MAAANESQGLKIAVAAFVALAVILAVTTYFGYSQYGQAQAKYEDAEKKLQTATRAIDDERTRVTELKQLAGYGRHRGLRGRQGRDQEERGRPRREAGHAPEGAEHGRRGVQGQRRQRQDGRGPEQPGRPVDQLAPDRAEQDLPVEARPDDGDHRQLQEAHAGVGPRQPGPPQGGGHAQRHQPAESSARRSPRARRPRTT